MSWDIRPSIVNLDQNYRSGWLEGVAGRPVPDKVALLDRVLNHTAALGLTAIDLMESYWSDVPSDSIAAALERRDVAGSTFIHVLPIAGPCLQALADQLLARSLDLRCAGFVNVMVVPDPRPVVDERDVPRLTQDLLTACASALAEAGCRLLFENCDWPPIRPHMGTMEQCSRIAETINADNVWLIFDTGAPVVLDRSWATELQTASTRLGAVHLKDLFSVGKPGDLTCDDPSHDFDGVALGRGQASIDRVISELRERRFSGPMTIEYVGMRDASAAVESSVAWLAERLGSV